MDANQDRVMSDVWQVHEGRWLATVVVIGRTEDEAKMLANTMILSLQEKYDGN